MTDLKDLMYHPGQDYHNFSHRGSDKEWRKRFNIGDIYTNAAVCNTCGWFIRSKNKHDYVRCNCKDSDFLIAVDGGSWYICRAFGKKANYTNVIEYFDDVKQVEEL